MNAWREWAIPYLGTVPPITVTHDPHEDRWYGESGVFYVSTHNPDEILDAMLRLMIGDLLRAAVLRAAVEVKE